MNPFSKLLAALTRSSAVRATRRKVGQVGAPAHNASFETLHRRDDRASERLDVVEHIVGDLQAHSGIDVSSRLRDLEVHMPTVLNSIASTNGTARLLRREMSSLDERTQGIEQWLNLEAGKFEAFNTALLEHFEALSRHDSDIARLDGHVRDELWPLRQSVEDLHDLRKTVEWLLERVETVRAEALFEVRYGADRSVKSTAQPSVEIVNADALHPDKPLRLNLGCGHVPLDGYVNIDMRPLPGVDVVAPIDALPFERGSVAEVFSAHVLEHFPNEELRRNLLPYWHSLIQPGGLFKAVVPDVEAMIEQLHAKEISFEEFREVAYGGQEYEGDFHFTAFTPDSLSAMLSSAGFVGVKLLERGRKNGDCLEFEIEARRPD